MPAPDARSGEVADKSAAWAWRAADATHASDAAERWSQALGAAALCAVDPVGLGGAILRAGAGPARDRWLECLRGLLPQETRFSRLPLHTDDARLLGGLDLAATLRAGRPIAQLGLLAQTDGGVLVVAMAERLSAGTAARLAAVLDSGVVASEREGMGLRHPARLGVVALDEGIDDEEAAPPALRERLAFHLSLEGLGRAALLDDGLWERADIERARMRLARIPAAEATVEALCAATLALGIDSPRAALFALRAARAAAALAGHDRIEDDDAALAARWVLAHRATRLPSQEPPDAPDAALSDSTAAPPADSSAAEPASEPSAAEPSQPHGASEEAADAPAASPPSSQREAEGALDEHVLEAALAALPRGLLESLSAGLPPASRSGASSGRSGAARGGRARGRPIGSLRGDVRAGARLDLLSTLRAAVPWQRLRAAESAAAAAAQPASPGGLARVAPRVAPRIAVRREDFHVRRFRERTETTAIFVVDASGSAALQRLAEAKGAVELLLADCYVRRDRVAVVAFRGSAAEVLLPPTRSLVRAKRSLAGLPGGGGTPLASGLDVARGVAESARRRGETPLLVLLTDGRGNVARDGAPGRTRAAADAIAAAGALRATGFAVLLLDTSSKPSPQAGALALALGARYVPLPHADAAGVSKAVRAVLAASTPER